MDQSARNRDYRSGSETIGEERISARRLGCVGLSIIVHLGFLAAMAVVPDTVRELHDRGNQTSGAVDMVDSNVQDAGSNDAVASAAPAQKEPVETTTLTDETSDVVAPAPVKAEAKPVVVEQPKVVEKPVEKPVAKAKPAPKAVVVAPIKVAQPKQAAPVQEAQEDVQTSDEAEAPPVLLANPPAENESDDVKPEAKEQASVQKEEPKKEEPKEEPAPVVAAAPIVHEKTERVEKTEHNSEQVAAQPTEEKQAAPVAAAAAPVKEQSQQGSEQAGEKQSGTGSTEQTEKSGTGAAAVVTGPIRDASQLKAAPGNPNPVYPARDRLQRKEGTAVILGRVTADGRVTDARLERSSGSAAMDSASLQAFSRWRFEGGQEGWVRKPFQFRLVGDAKEVPAQLGQQAPTRPTSVR